MDKCTKNNLIFHGKEMLKILTQVSATIKENILIMTVPID